MPLRRHVGHGHGPVDDLLLTFGDGDGMDDFTDDESEDGYGSEDIVAYQFSHDLGPYRPI